MYQDIFPEEVNQWKQKGAQIIDVREPGEYTSGHLPGAVNIPLGQLPNRTDEVKEPVVLVCASGNRSGQAAQYLAEQGYVVDVRPPATKTLELPPEDAGTWERLRASFDGGAPLVMRVLEQAYTITQSRLIELTYALHPPDFTVMPDFGEEFDVQDFSRFKEAYEIGLRDTRKLLAGMPRES